MCNLTVFATIRNGDLIKFQELIDDGIDVNRKAPQGHGYLHFCVIYNRADMCKILLPLVEDINSKASYISATTLYNGKMGAPKLYKGPKGRKSLRIWTPLMLAEDIRSIEITKLIKEEIERRGKE
jgi:ankyrin repeat protein